MLIKRLLTALVLIPPLFILLMWGPNWALVLLVAVLWCVGAWEWAGFFGDNAPIPRWVYAIFSTGVFLSFFALSQFYPAVAPILLLCGLPIWLLAAYWVVRYPADFPPENPLFLRKFLIGLLVLPMSGFALVHIHGVIPQGGAYIVALLAIVFGSDTGAYILGNWIGKTKLAPQLSPGKTWEGAVGGLLGGLLFSGIAVWYFNYAGMQAVYFMLFGMCIAVLSIIGDLTESLFKRHSGVKDSGNFFPGHGGVLDRVDSVIAAAPLFAYGLLHFTGLA